MNKKIFALSIFLCLILLCSCSNEKIEKLEKEKDENNKHVRDTTAPYMLNKNAANEIVDDVMDYLKNMESEDTDFNGFLQDSYFEYNMIVYKTHLLYGIENAIESELEKAGNTDNLTKQKVKREITEIILNSLEVEYFYNPDSKDLEQMFIFTLPDGKQGIFISLWQDARLTYTNVYLKEVI